MTEREFADVVKRTKGIVLSAVEKHLAPRFCHAIDDVVQETYLRAYRGLTNGKFRGDSALGTWLFTIAKNESLRMTARLVREEQKAEKYINYAAGITSDNKIVQISGMGNVNRYGEEDVASMRMCIQSLPDKYRDVLELVADGCSEKEIASHLAIKTGTVKSRLSRGREMLARRMEGCVDL